MNTVEITKPDMAIVDAVVALVASYVELTRINPEDPLLPLIAESIASFVFPRITLTPPGAAA